MEIHNNPKKFRYFQIWVKFELIRVQIVIPQKHFLTKFILFHKIDVKAAKHGGNETIPSIGKHLQVRHHHTTKYLLVRIPLNHF